MTRSALLAMTIVSLAPATAWGATVVTPAAGAAVDRFSVAVLIEGVDHVLSSVDDRTALPVDPFGSGAAAFASYEIVTRAAGLTTRNAPAYGSADLAREPLPEPATWLMMILGFFGLSFAVRRRSIGTGDRVRFS